MKINLSKKIFLIFIFSLFLCAPTFASTIARPISNSGLVGYWNFEEGAGSVVYDRSGQGNAGSLTSTTWTNSNTGQGQALSFNGSTSFVDLGNLSIANFASADFSVSIWFKTSAASGVKYLISKRNICFHESFWNISVDANSGGTLIAEIDDNNVNYNVVSSAGAVNNGQWHHGVVVRNGTTVRVYVDGILSNSGTTGGITNISNAANINLGSGPCFDSKFPGSIDEVRIYNRALVGDEISRLYKIQKPKVTGGVSNTGLVGYWPLDDGTGTRAEDVSVNNSTGTLTNGPTWTNGKNGKALFFDGVDDYIDIGNTPAITPPNAITISAWIRATTTTSVTNGIIDDDNNGTIGYFLRINSSGKLFGRFNSTTITGNTTLEPNTWYHVALVYDGANVYVYLNGVSDATPVARTGVITYSGLSKNIGKRPAGGAQFNGTIDEFRMYDRGLSASEVYALYKGTIATVVNKSKTDRMTNGLVGYWTFDANKLAGSAVYDSSVSGITGSITNNAPPTIGRIGQALSFNGTNQNVSITDDNALDLSSSYSISTWVYGTSYNVATNNWIGIVTKGNTGEAAANNHNFILGYNNNAGFGASNRWLFDLENSAGANCDLLGNASAATSTWYHLVGVFDNPNDIMSLYVNGELQGQVSCTFTPNTNALPVLIGDDAHSSSIPWSGKIDDVRIYNRALTADEARALYNLGK